MNIQKMIKQSQEMHQQLSAMNDDIAKMQIIGKADGVSLTFKGDGFALSATVDASLKGEKLQQAIVEAINDARTQINAAAQEAKQNKLGGMPIPPNLPLDE